MTLRRFQLAQTPWRIVGEEVATCNCAWGCPCQFNALPTHGRCEAVTAIRIREGHYGKTKLDGLTFSAAFWWPGPIHLGNGIVRMAIDEKANEDQRIALLNIASGKEGGTFFEIFASTVSQVLDPIFAPIEFESDAVTRVAKLKVAGHAEFRTEPIRNPVTGQEHRARIQLPDGFEYKVAEMANCIENHAMLGDKTIQNKNSYAQFASVEWSNG